MRVIFYTSIYIVALLKKNCNRIVVEINTLLFISLNTSYDAEIWNSGNKNDNYSSRGV